MAKYTLRITLPDGREPVPNSASGQIGAAGVIPPMGFTCSVAEWGRRLSIHLNGLSKGGEHTFGVISEPASMPLNGGFWPLDPGWSLLSTSEIDVPLTRTRASLALVKT